MSSLIKSLVMMTWYPEERRQIALPVEEGIPEYLLRDGLTFICQGRDEEFKREALHRLAQCYPKNQLILERIAAETLSALEVEEWASQFQSFLGTPLIEIMGERHEASEAMLRVFLELKGIPKSWILAPKLLRWNHNRLLHAIQEDEIGPEMIRLGRDSLNWLRECGFEVSEPIDSLVAFIARLMPQLRPNLISSLRQFNATGQSIRFVLSLLLALDSTEWDERILGLIDPSLIREELLNLAVRVRSRSDCALAWTKKVIAVILERGSCPGSLIEALDASLFDRCWLVFLGRDRSLQPSILTKFASHVELILIEGRPMPFLSEVLLPWLLQNLPLLPEIGIVLLARVMAYCVRLRVCPLPAIDLQPSSKAAWIRFILYSELGEWINLDDGLVRLQYYLSAGLFEQAAEIKVEDATMAFSYLDWQSGEVAYWVGLIEAAARLRHGKVLEQITLQQEGVHVALALWQHGLNTMDDKIYSQVCHRLLSCSVSQILNCKHLESALNRLYQSYVQNAPFMPDQIPSIVLATLDYDSSQFIPSLFQAGQVSAALVLTAAHPRQEAISLVWPTVAKKLRLHLPTPSRLPSKARCLDPMGACLSLLTALKPFEIDACIKQLRENALWPQILRVLPWSLAWALPNKLLF